jgi:hypothetical protein
MKIDLPQPPPRRGLPSRAARAAAGAPAVMSLALLTALALAALPGCGGSSEEEPVESAGCASDAECAGGQRCVEAACVEPSPATGMSAGPLACSVLRCPPSEPSCCMAAAASATGNESEGYASRNQMVVSATSDRDSVRATFSFDAADQQGWLTFRFDSELHLARLDVVGAQFGVADRFLTVNTNRSSEDGCSFGFELEPRPSETGEGPAVLGNDIAFNSNDFCYGNGRPGRASELAFAIFALRPGEATLVISNITLRE